MSKNVHYAYSVEIINMKPSMLEQAIAGNPEAIAAIINHNLQKHNILID